MCYKSEQARVQAVFVNCFHWAAKRGETGLRVAFSERTRTEESGVVRIGDPQGAEGWLKMWPRFICVPFVSFCVSCLKWQDWDSRPRDWSASEFSFFPLQYNYCFVNFKAQLSKCSWVILVCDQAKYLSDPFRVYLTDWLRVASHFNAEGRSGRVLII